MASDRRADRRMLDPLLVRNRQMHPGFRVSNHLSMSLLSLAALGGSPDHARRLAELSLPKLKPFPTGGPHVSPRAWRGHLGNTEALPGFRNLFERWIAREGVAATQRRCLPDLLPGLGAAAFHAMIRTAYGVRFDDAQEVALGLAYWASTFLPLGPLMPNPQLVDPDLAIAAVRDQPALTAAGRRAHGIVMPRQLNIAGKMGWVSTLPGFPGAASSLRVDEGSLEAIARTVVRLFVSTGDDFTALHAITGTHAYRMLEPHLADPLAGRRYLWQALVAAYVSMGSPALSGEVPEPPLPTWKQVLARATRSDDDHELKLTDVAFEEFRHYGDRQYLHAAAVHLKLVPPAATSPHSR